jgi:hypothetical protein
MSRAKGRVETSQYAAFARRMIRAYARRAGEEMDPEDLAEMLGLLAEFEQACAVAIHTGRETQEWSWADIGRAAGTTRSAAFQRWSKQPQEVAT